MPYDDELGVVLDRLHRGDLAKLATQILGLDHEEISGLGEWTLRRRCSNELRSAGGHSVMNMFRDDHGLPYIEIVRDVAEKTGVDVSETDDVLMIERKLVDEQARVIWSSLDAPQQQNLTKRLKYCLQAKALERRVDITREVVETLIKKGITRKAVSSFFGVGQLASATGHMLGYNVVQEILLQRLLSYFGIWTAGKAVIGVGAAGLAMRVAAFAGPIGIALSVAYSAHWLAGPAYRRTVPAVIFVAAKRLEIFSFFMMKQTKVTAAISAGSS